jgi:hypothetical protein
MLLAEHMLAARYRTLVKRLCLAVATNSPVWVKIE